jgi:hypothetical protein
MIRHVVLFRFRPEVTPSQVADVRTGLGELPGRIPEIRAYHFGGDAGVNPGNFDMAVTGDFDSVEDYLTYRDHPDHQRVVKELLTPLVAERAAVQFEW